MSTAADRLRALIAEEPKGTPAERFQLALSLCRTAEAMFLARLRCEEPHLTEDQRQARLDLWYLDRPGAPHGDAVGTPRAWTTD